MDRTVGFGRNGTGPSPKMICPHTLPLQTPAHRVVWPPLVTIITLCVSEILAIYASIDLGYVFGRRQNLRSLLRISRSQFDTRQYSSASNTALHTKVLAPRFF